MVYVIDRYFEEKIDEELILRINEYTVEQLTEIVGLISLLYKEYTSSDEKCPMDKMKRVLTEVFSCEDVRYNFEYKKEIPFIRRRLMSKTLFMGFQLSGNCVVWLDINEAEGMCQRKDIYELLKRYVGKDKRLQIKEIFG